MLCHLAMLQKWWKQQVGSPWWRLTHTWLPKLIALWLQPNAPFLDPHASASNNPNNHTAGHLHSYTLTQAYTHHKTQHFTPETQDKYSPCCYLLHYLHPAPSRSLQPHPFLLYVLFVNCEGKWQCHRKRREWKSGAGGLVKWMLFTRKPQPNPFFSSAPGIMRSDIVLFPMCEVKSFNNLR